MQKVALRNISNGISQKIKNANMILAMLRNYVQ